MNPHLLCSSCKWFSKDHLFSPLKLRISFRLHFLYSFSIIYDFSLSYTKPVHDSRQLYLCRRGTVRAAPLCNMCGLPSSVLSGALIKGSTVGLWYVSCAPSITASIQRRLEQQMKGRRWETQRLSTSMWSCLIQSWRIYLMYLQPYIFFPQKVSQTRLHHDIWCVIFTEWLFCILSILLFHYLV